ncbi:sulfotransferase family 2 domain-containing protein [Parahaliea mediterranea]|uniref:sulfotransferase family 2 domain-containing protein n=1 Tax=Parahaliea mediterranea TaxID=651086 RepID=UPI0019D43223|nr:sulfotransferase family 2 domain-containing protein [Parahaliea mediterranea]
MGFASDSAARFRYWHRTLRERHLRPWVFIHINKTGGSSIEKALGAGLDHSTALEKYRQLGADAWARKFVFSVVRNPWDKVVSHYHYRVKTNQTGLGEQPIPFAEWLQRCYVERDSRYYDQPRMFMAQRDWLVDEHGEMLVEFVGRFETLQQDFEGICQRIGVQASLGHAKPSDRGSYRDYYNADTQAIIAEAFAADIDSFGYRF